jgi:hypothetical protein
MTQLPRRFIEDRALRDAARAVLVNDIDRLRASLDEQGIASRVSSGVTTTISSRIRSGARDVLDQAKAQAGDHKGVLALLIGGIILWLSRGPILDWMDELAEDFDLAEEDIDPTVAPAGAPADDAQGEPE